VDKENIAIASLLFFSSGVFGQNYFVPPIVTEIESSSHVGVVETYSTVPRVTKVQSGKPLFSSEVPLALQPPRVRYTENEKRSIDVANKQRGKQLDVFESDDGSVQYVFGQAIAVIVCAPLRLCNLQLQEGEIVNDVNLGDTQRWSVTPSVSGESPNQVVHAVIKPSDVGLQTSMIITTDRRVYHLTLKSSATDYMPSVSFHYPVTQANEWDNLIKTQRDAAATAQSAAVAEQQAQAQSQNRGTPRLGIVVDDLNFDYRISRGRFNWRPLRVFDDGIRTFIELPDSALNGDLPIVLAADSTEEIVNYRLKENRYIVDGISQRLIMLRNVGRNQQRLTIERR